MEPRYPLLAMSSIMTAAIFYYSALPAAGPGSCAFSPGGEAVHFVVYAVYAAVVAATLRSLPAKRPLLFALVAAAALGAATELVQLFSPGRVCDASDWATDFLGAVAGLAALYLLKHKTKRRE